jgi:sarcosine oxidase
MTTTQFDVIVIGVGGMGSAAAYHLSTRGHRVLALERHGIPHDLGSSHGVNRIIRLAYFEHPDYVPLLRRSYELWRELEWSSCERLLFITGSIDAGPSNGEIVRGSLESCRMHNLPHETLDAASLSRRFPGFNLPEDYLAVYQPDGGFVLAERGIVAHVFGAQRHGASIRGHERALSWTSNKRGVTVVSDRGVYEAATLLVTAGPWLASLVPHLAPFAVPQRQVLLWTQPQRPEHFALGAFPVFNLEGENGRYYGFPVYSVPGFKLGKYFHREQDVDPELMERSCEDQDETVLRTAVERYFPGANGPTMNLKTCLFTNTPDHHFIVDHHPEHENVWIAGGFSGHGYKFCPVIGEILSDLAIHGRAARDISLFRSDRF